MNGFSFTNENEINNESFDESENDEDILDEEYFKNLKKNLHDIYNDITKWKYELMKIKGVKK